MSKKIFFSFFIFVVVSFLIKTPSFAQEFEPELNPEGGFGSEYGPFLPGGGGGFPEYGAYGSGGSMGPGMGGFPGMGCGLGSLTCGSPFTSTGTSGIPTEYGGIPGVDPAAFSGGGSLYPYGSGYEGYGYGSSGYGGGYGSPYGSPYTGGYENYFSSFYGGLGRTGAGEAPPPEVTPEYPIYASSSPCTSGPESGLVQTINNSVRILSNIPLVGQTIGAIAPQVGDCGTLIPSNNPRFSSPSETPTTEEEIDEVMNRLLNRHSSPSIGTNCEFTDITCGAGEGLARRGIGECDASDTACQETRTQAYNEELAKQREKLKTSGFNEGAIDGISQDAATELAKSLGESGIPDEHIRATLEANGFCNGQGKPSCDSVEIPSRASGPANPNIPTCGTTGTPCADRDPGFRDQRLGTPDVNVRSTLDGTNARNDLRALESKYANDRDGFKRTLNRLIQDTAIETGLSEEQIRDYLGEQLGNDVSATNPNFYKDKPGAVNCYVNYFLADGTGCPSDMVPGSRSASTTPGVGRTTPGVPRLSTTPRSSRTSPRVSPGAGGSGCSSSTGGLGGFGAGGPFGASGGMSPFGSFDGGFGDSDGAIPPIFGIGSLPVGSGYGAGSSTGTGCPPSGSGSGGTGGGSSVSPSTRPAVPTAIPTTPKTTISPATSSTAKAPESCKGIGVNSSCGFWMSPTCSMRIAQGCEEGNPPYITHENSDAVDLEPESACGKPVYAPVDGTYESISIDPPPDVPGAGELLGYHFYPKQNGCDTKGYSLLHMRNVVVPLGSKREFKQGDYLGTIGCSGSGSTNFVPCHLHLSTGRPDISEQGYNPFCEKQISPWLDQKDEACHEGR